MGKFNYIGQKVLIFPNDYQKKYGIIHDIDEYGWTIKIKKIQNQTSSDNVAAGDILFVPFSHNTFTFKILKEFPNE